MISVDEALKRIFDLLPEPGVETVPLGAACRRVLARSLATGRNQPPYAVSAMDGYAVRGSRVQPGAEFRVIGESAAGGTCAESVTGNDAIRIFTGARVPSGADRIVIQEDVARDGELIVVREGVEQSSFIRQAGSDFEAGWTIDAPKRLGATDISLLAAMNFGKLSVFRRPQIALVPTGDELVMPGETSGEDVIVASNGFGLKAMLEEEGAQARLLPIVRDNETSLETAFGLALDSGADVIVTIGGASVGTYDLVRKVLESMDASISFHGVAIRPGKPLLAGKLGSTTVIGLPGNPVSSIVCGHVFLVPAVRALLGLDRRSRQRQRGQVLHDVRRNFAREHYMRARVFTDEAVPSVRIFRRQDSSLLSVLAEANCLAVRSPNARALREGDPIDFIGI